MDNSSSSHTDNRMNNFLGKGPTDDSNGSVVLRSKSSVLNLVK